MTIGAMEAIYSKGQHADAWWNADTTGRAVKIAHRDDGGACMSTHRVHPANVCVLMIDQLAILVFQVNNSKGCVDTARTPA